MPDANFDDVYDPIATPNPAYDDDDPAPGRRSLWEGRSLAHVLLERARARQDAIADAFVDAMIGGKISLFRLLLDLEKAAVAGEAEAQEARLPTLAELLIPMLDRERKQAAEQAVEQVAAAEAASSSSSQPAPPISAFGPSALASASSNEAVFEAQASLAEGVTDLQGAAETALAAASPHSCRIGLAARRRPHASGERKGKMLVPIQDTLPLSTSFLSPDLEMRLGWSQRIWRTLKEKS